MEFDEGEEDDGEDEEDQLGDGKGEDKEEDVEDRARIDRDEDESAIEDRVEASRFLVDSDPSVQLDVTASVM